MSKDFGVVEPGSTLYIEFDSFGASNESITLTGLAVTDIEIYRDGSVTQRSSDNGYTLLDTDGIDFDALTGIHGLSINLSDNSDAGFFRAGSHYRVVISSVTINAQTVSFTAATFRIGHRAAVLNTYVSSVQDKQAFILAAGPTTDGALAGMWGMVYDVSGNTTSWCEIRDYVGATKRCVITNDLGFSIAANDSISIIAPLALMPIGQTPSTSAGGRPSPNRTNFVSRRSTTFSSDTTAHAVGMPTTLVEIGDLILTAFVNNGDSTVTTPAGMTLLNSTANSTLVRSSIYAKIADGTETATTVDFVTSAAEKAAAYVWHFKKDNWYGDITNGISISTAATGSSTTVSPNAVTQSWGSLESLTIAIAASEDAAGTETISAAVANGGFEYVTAGAATGCLVGYSAIHDNGSTLAAATSFTLSTTEDWIAHTVAIRPPDSDVYNVGAEFTRDQGNTKDEYTVVSWLRNSIPVKASEITSPTIQVTKRVDGTDLIAVTAMTQIGSSGSYKYDEATNRLTLGEAVDCTFRATIRGAVREWPVVFTRDSA